MQTQHKVSQKCYLTPFPPASGRDSKNVWDRPPQLKSNTQCQQKVEQQWPHCRMQDLVATTEDRGRAMTPHRMQDWVATTEDRAPAMTPPHRMKERVATTEDRSQGISLNAQCSVSQISLAFQSLLSARNINDGKDSQPHLTSKKDRWQGTPFRVLYHRPERAAEGALTLPGRKFHEEPGCAGKEKSSKSWRRPPLRAAFQAKAFHPTQQTIS